MTDELADEYAMKALGWKPGSPFEVVVGLLNVPAVTRALERQGCTVAEGERAGRLVVWRPGEEPPEPASVLARRDRAATRLVRFVRSNHLDNSAASAALGATPEELVHLRMGRYREIGNARLEEMAERLDG